MQHSNFTCHAVSFSRIIPNHFRIVSVSSTVLSHFCNLFINSSKSFLRGKAFICLSWNLGSSFLNWYFLQLIQHFRCISTFSCIYRLFIHRVNVGTVSDLLREVFLFLMLPFVTSSVSCMFVRDFDRFTYLLKMALCLTDRMATCYHKIHCFFSAFYFHA